MGLFGGKSGDALRCHHTGFRDTCEEHQKHCPKYIYLRMRDPQSKQEIDEYGCSDTFDAKLKIEQARETRSVGAAIVSARNEAVTSAGQLAQAIMHRPVLVQLPAQDVRPMLDGSGK